MLTLELDRMAEVPRACARRIGRVEGRRVHLTAEQYQEVIKSRGIGDRLAELFEAVGVTWLTGKLFPRGCGCVARRRRLNILGSRLAAAWLRLRSRPSR